MVITRDLISLYELGSIPKGSTKYIMTEQDKKQIILTEQETWAGAAKEFFRQFGSVATLLILVLTVGQCTDCVDVYRLLGR